MGLRATTKTLKYCLSFFVELIGHYIVKLLKGKQSIDVFLLICTVTAIQINLKLAVSSPVAKVPK